MREAELFVRADQTFSSLVAMVRDRWDMSVPSTPEWTVRTLVEHVIENNYSLQTALQGSSKEHHGSNETGTRWAESAKSAEQAAFDCSDVNKPAPMPPLAENARDALTLQTADRLLHSWDLAQALSIDEIMDAELVQVVFDYLHPHVEDLRAIGVFGPQVAVAEGATLQERLLALTGRNPGTEHHEDPEASSRIDEIHRSS